MAAQITVVSNSVTTEFLQFSDTVGSVARYFIDFIPQAADFDNKRFRAPGWNGNALIRGGFMGQQLTLNVRYQATTLAGAAAAWKADRDRWAEYSASINDNVTTWSRCTLRPGSGNRTTEDLAHGPTHKFFEVRYVFDAEELY